VVWGAHLRPTFEMKGQVALQYKKKQGAHSEKGPFGITAQTLGYSPYSLGYGPCSLGYSPCSLELRTQR
jgi:hypothetical protein